jgi:hypothetical protein
MTVSNGGVAFQGYYNGIILAVTEVNNIVLFCMPSHKTHHLQPFDKDVYGSFEAFWVKKF